MSGTCAQPRGQGAERSEASAASGTGANPGLAGAGGAVPRTECEPGPAAHVPCELTRIKRAANKLEVRFAGSTPVHRHDIKAHLRG